MTPELPSLTQQSVHNIVQDLAAVGILQRISPPASSAALYEIADDAAHHHVQCVHCGSVVDVPAAKLPAPAAARDGADGMTIIGVEVTYLGVCAACGAASPGSAGSDNSAGSDSGAGSTSRAD